MDSKVAKLLPARPRIRRAWQWTGLILFCLSQQGCMCGCSHPHTNMVTRLDQESTPGLISRPARDGEPDVTARIGAK
jgi:hypothetical protein